MTGYLPRFALLAGLAVGSASAATPPPQPRSGPGGTDYVAGEVVRRAVGQASAPAFVFHASSAPSGPRPVVVFFPAWGVTNPLIYGGWIEHLARRGALVVFPRYQEPSRTRPADATGLAAEMLKATMASLKDDAEARPDPSRVVFVGHLAGAPIAANIAAVAKAQDIPPPRLLFMLMPGGVARDAKARGIPLADLAQVDDGTLVATMIGDREHLPSDRTAKLLLREIASVPAGRKLFLRALSDDHGFPVVSATLASPASPKDEFDSAKIKVPADPPNDPKALRLKRQKWSADMVLTGEQTLLLQQMGANTTDALDYLAFWKSLDLLMAAAFSGQDAAAVRKDSALYDMGRWSDTKPLRRVGAADPPVK